VETEVQKILKFDCLRKAQKKEITSPLFQYCILIWCFDLNHDFRCKVRIVDGGHRINCIDLDASGSTISSLSLRLALVVGATKQHDVIIADITNAYLIPYTSELIYTKLGLEFHHFAGVTVRIIKALYSLKASRHHRGANWLLLYVTWVLKNLD